MGFLSRFGKALNSIQEQRVEQSRFRVEIFSASFAEKILPGLDGLDSFLHIMEQEGKG